MDAAVERDTAVELNIIREPSVYLVGRQAVEQGAMRKFLEDHGVEWAPDTEVPAELLSEAAGRLCYMSFGKGRRSSAEYLENILTSAHGSVLEHAVWNFIFSGVSRSFTHELVRHRAGFGYSQLSQRYVNESEADFIEPDCIAEDPEAHRIWLDAVATAQRSYTELVGVLRKKFDYVEDRTLRRELARQAARSVLPNATETKIFVTANARALRHFIELRGSEHAEVEIRKVAVKVLDIMRVEAPGMFGDFESIELDDGSKAARARYHKV